MNINVTEFINLNMNEIILTKCKTNIDTQKSSFTIECNIEIENKDEEDLMKKIFNFKFLFGKDSIGKDFTLYNCSARIIEIQSHIIKKIFVVYNFCIYGKMIENLNNLKINEFQSIINDTNFKLQTQIGKNEWKIEDSIIIKTDWNFNDTKIEGIKILIKDENNRKTFEDLLSVYENILCIFFWILGFFPNNKQISFSYENTQVYYFEANEKIYNTKDIIDDKQVLFYSLDNFQIVYNKWKEMYSSNLILFHMFFDIQNNNNFEEVKTFNYIQCLECLYSRFFNIMRFDNSNRDEIIKIFVEILNTNKKNKLANKIKKVIKNIKKEGYNYDVDTLKKSLSGKLNDINKLSLHKIIDKIFEREEAKAIFKYEYEHKNSRTKKYLIKEFKNKMYNHRNFMAHLDYDKNFFKGEENTLAQLKLKLLFRTIIINMLGINIVIDSLDKYIKKINSDYYQNKMD